MSVVSPLCHCSFVLFLGHSWFILSYIVHLYFVYLWVLFLSFRFFSLSSSLVWWWRVLVLKLQVRLVTPFVPPLGFNLRVLVWGDHLGLGFEVHLLDHVGMAVGLLCRLFRKKTKKKLVLIWCSCHYYLGFTWFANSITAWSSEVILGLRDLFFF